MIRLTYAYGSKNQNSAMVLIYSLLISFPVVFVQKTVFNTNNLLYVHTVKIMFLQTRLLSGLNLFNFCSYVAEAICDRACENRAYLHTNFASFFKRQTDVTLYIVILSQ